MSIPAFDEYGFLPPGVYPCSMEEIRDRFGVFDRSDRRVRLFQELTEYVQEVIAIGMVVSIILDGSFVTEEPEPNDIDLILVLRHDHDFMADLRPIEYNVLSKRSVRKRHGIDVLIARDRSSLLTKYVEFFQGVRQSEHVRKGILQVVL